MNEKPRIVANASFMRADGIRGVGGESGRASCAGASKSVIENIAVAAHAERS
jgi:hypothetical protein